MKRRQHSFSVPGISLILLIFLSLCLITFSLLSLSGAAADENLSQRAADRTSVYYQASNRANDILSAIDGHLAEYLLQAETSSDPAARYLELCSGLSEPDSDYTLEESTLSFSVPVTDGQILQAELELTYPEKDDDTLYKIKTWKIVNTGKWSPDTHLNLYHPDP